MSNGDCYNIACEVMSLLYQQVAAGKISPGLKDCNNQCLAEGTKMLTCDAYLVDKAEIEKNWENRINELANKHKDDINDAKAYADALFKASRNVIHDSSLVGNGVCGDPLSINETYLDSLIHSLIYVDQNSIKGTGLQDNPYHVDSTWFNEGFDQNSIVGDRDSGKLHVDEKWLNDEIHHMIYVDKNSVIGAGTEQDPYKVSNQWENNLYDQNSIQGDANDPNNKYHVNPDWMFAQLAKTQINGDDTSGITSQSVDNWLPTILYGSRDAALGRPDVWIKLGNLPFVIPAYNYSK